MEHFYKTISKFNFTFAIALALLFLPCLSLAAAAQENEDEVLYIEEVTINVDSQEVIELDLKEFGDVISFDELILNENFVESKEQLSINIYSFNYPYRNFLLNTLYTSPYYYDVMLFLAMHDKDLYYKFSLDITNIVDPSPNTVKSLYFTGRVAGISNRFIGADLFINYHYDPLTALSERNWYYIGIKPFYKSNETAVSGELSMESDSLNSVFNADLTFSYSFNLSPSLLSIALQYKSKGSDFVSFSPGLWYSLTFDDMNNLSMFLYYDIAANAIFPSASLLLKSPFVFSLSLGRYYGEIAKMSFLQYFFINSSYSASIDDFFEVKAHTIVKEQTLAITINAAYRYYYTLVYPLYSLSPNYITSGNLKDISSVYFDLVLSIPLESKLSFDSKIVCDFVFSDAQVHDPFVLNAALSYNFSPIFMGKLLYDNKLFRYDTIGSLNDFHSLGFQFLYHESATELSLAVYYFMAEYELFRGVVIPYQWYIALSMQIFL